MTNIQHKKARSGKLFAGMVLIVIGTIFLLERLGVIFPDWVISFPMLLIAIGVYLGSKQQFRRPWPIILIVVGVFFLADDIVPNINFSAFIVPLILITIGGFLIMGRNKQNWKEQWKKSPFDWNAVNPEPGPGPEPGPAPADGPAFADPANTFSAYGKEKSSFSAEDYIDTVSVFGAVKKNLVSKNFKGGEIVNFMGGAEINLIQADFQGRIELDVTQVFGGCRIIVPPHWQIHSEMAAIFGGVEDKRPLHSDTASSDKVLIIKGTSVFGGIDIRSF